MFNCWRGKEIPTFKHKNQDTSGRKVYATPHFLLLSKKGECQQCPLFLLLSRKGEKPGKPHSPPFSFLFLGRGASQQEGGKASKAPFSFFFQGRGTKPEKPPFPSSFREGGQSQKSPSFSFFFLGRGKAGGSPLFLLVSRKGECQQRQHFPSSFWEGGKPANPPFLLLSRKGVKPAKPPIPFFFLGKGESKQHPPISFFFLRRGECQQCPFSFFFPEEKSKRNPVSLLLRKGVKPAKPTHATPLSFLVVCFLRFNDTLGKAETKSKKTEKHGTRASARLIQGVPRKPPQI